MTKYRKSSGQNTSQFVNFCRTQLVLVEFSFPPLDPDSCNLVLFFQKSRLNTWKTRTWSDLKENRTSLLISSLNLASFVNEFLFRWKANRGWLILWYFSERAKLCTDWKAANSARSKFFSRRENNWKGTLLQRRRPINWEEIQLALQSTRTFFVINRSIIWDLRFHSLMSTNPITILLWSADMRTRILPPMEDNACATITQE